MGARNEQLHGPVEATKCLQLQLTSPNNNLNHDTDHMKYGGAMYVCMPIRAFISSWPVSGQDLRDRLPKVAANLNASMSLLDRP